MLIRLVIIIFFFFSMLNTSRAESIELKTGKIIEGEIVEETNTYLKIQTVQRLVKIPKRQIKGNASYSEQFSQEINKKDRQIEIFVGSDCASCAPLPGPIPAAGDYPMLEEGKIYEIAGTVPISDTYYTEEMAAMAEEKLRLMDAGSRYRIQRRVMQGIVPWYEIDVLINGQVTTHGWFNGKSIIGQQITEVQ